MAQNTRVAAGETNPAIPGVQSSAIWGNGSLQGGNYGALRVQTLVDLMKAGDINEIRRSLDLLLAHTHNFEVNYSVPDPRARGTGGSPSGGSNKTPSGVAPNDGSKFPRKTESAVHGTGSFPNKIILKWGPMVPSDDTIIFNTAFPNSCLCVVLAPRGNSAGGVQTGAARFGKASFDLFKSTAPVPSDWIAIGS